MRPQTTLSPHAPSETAKLCRFTERERETERNSQRKWEADQKVLSVCLTNNLLYDCWFTARRVLSLPLFFRSLTRSFALSLYLHFSGSVICEFVYGVHTFVIGLYWRTARQCFFLQLASTECHDMQIYNACGCRQVDCTCVWVFENEAKIANTMTQKREKRTSIKSSKQAMRFIEFACKLCNNKIFAIFKAYELSECLAVARQLCWTKQ